MRKFVHYMVWGIIFLLFLVGCTSVSNNQTTPPQKNVESNDYVNKPVHRLEGAIPVGFTPDKKLVGLKYVESGKTNNILFVLDTNQGNKEDLVTASPAKVIYDAVVSGERVIYAEASNDMVKADWSISALTFEDKANIMIDSGHVDENVLNLSTPTLIGPLLSASGDKVAWSTFELDENHVPVAVVKLYDFQTGKISTVDKINASEREFGHPHLDQNLIVYDRGRIDQKAGGRWGEIILKDLTNGTVRELDNGLNVVSPVVRYPYVAWKAGGSLIKVLDLRNNSIETISAGDGGEIWLPSLGDNVLTWLENSYRASVYLLPSGPEITLKGDGCTGGAKISGNILFWTVREKTPVSEWIDLSQQ